jgi:hypothetical protein
LVEDAGYYWTLSRYIHLNPCNGGKPLVKDPESWSHSSFPGYARKSKRVDWIAYDQLHTYWNASVGGNDPGRAYRAYVKQGQNVPEDPFLKTRSGASYASGSLVEQGKRGQGTSRTNARETGEVPCSRLPAFFGISGTGSVSNLVRQAQTRHDQSRSWRAKATKVEHALKLNTQHKA